MSAYTLPGMPSQQCSATNRHTGQQCRRKATRGASVCRSHGAQHTSVQRSAETNRIVWAAAQHDINSHPMTTLLLANSYMTLIMNERAKVLARLTEAGADEIAVFMRITE